MSRHHDYNSGHTEDDLPAGSTKLYKYFHSLLSALQHPDVPEFMDVFLRNDLVLLAKHLSKRLSLSGRLNPKETKDARAIDRSAGNARASEEAEDFREPWEDDNLESQE